MHLTSGPSPYDKWTSENSTTPLKGHPCNEGAAFEAQDKVGTESAEVEGATETDAPFLIPGRGLVPIPTFNSGLILFPKNGNRRRAELNFLETIASCQDMNISFEIWGANYYFFGPTILYPLKEHCFHLTINKVVNKS